MSADRILNVLKFGPLPAKDVAGKAALGYSTATRLLRDLQTAGQVEKDGKMWKIFGGDTKPVDEAPESWSPADEDFSPPIGATEPLITDTPEATEAATEGDIVTTETDVEANEPDVTEEPQADDMNAAEETTTAKPAKGAKAPKAAKEKAVKEPKVAAPSKGDEAKKAAEALGYSTDVSRVPMKEQGEGFGHKGLEGALKELFKGNADLAFTIGEAMGAVGAPRQVDVLRRLVAKGHLVAIEGRPARFAWSKTQPVEAPPAQAEAEAVAGQTPAPESA